MTTAAPPRPLTMARLAELGVDRLQSAQPHLAALEAAGIASLADLLGFYPRRWIDRSTQVAINHLPVDAWAFVIGRVESARTHTGKQGRQMCFATINDGHGSLSITFFGQPWRTDQFAKQRGKPVAVYGQVQLYHGRPQMTNPIVDFVGDRVGRVVPMYPQSEAIELPSEAIEAMVAETLARCEQAGFSDPVPFEVRAKLGLAGRAEAMRHIHLADSMDEQRAARRRLAFDELLRLQLGLVQRKRQAEAVASGVRHAHGALLPAFIGGLPFRPTNAQARAINEITADMQRPIPMNRLLQGDVGAGKSLVASAVVAMCLQGGHQAALLAPTEVLAEQLYAGAARSFEKLTVADRATLFGTRPIRVELLTGRTKGKARTAILADLASGAIDVIVGTHALLEPSVEFHDLGLAVVDEQHRFGVEQRSALKAKGRHGEPDLLAMTATPIPRSAAMTVYGDLDVSVLDELPPGRTPIVTMRAMNDSPIMWEQIRTQVGEGRQAYVVTPLVESATAEARMAASATTTRDALAAGPLVGLRVGLLHGKMKPEAKDEVMTEFREHRLDVLVATTVIEVGVDVPNATVIVILDADRFGIAQLHQLRGRVGRGRHASCCYLTTAEMEPNPRLQALVDSTDGFALAEADLELRGEGKVFGDAQSGKSDLKLASLRRDRKLIEQARAAAFEIIDGGLMTDEMADEVAQMLGAADRLDWLTRG